MKILSIFGAFLGFKIRKYNKFLNDLKIFQYLNVLWWLFCRLCFRESKQSNVSTNVANWSPFCFLSKDRRARGTCVGVVATRVLFHATRAMDRESRACGTFRRTPSHWDVRRVRLQESSRVQNVIKNKLEQILLINFVKTFNWVKKRSKSGHRNWAKRSSF